MAIYAIVGLIYSSFFKVLIDYIQSRVKNKMLAQSVYGNVVF